MVGRCKNVTETYDFLKFLFVFLMFTSLSRECNTALRDLSYIMYSKVNVNTNCCPSGQNGYDNHHLYACKMKLQLFV